MEFETKRGRWGPQGKQAAISFTFDNLGEASDIEFGRWPTDVAAGAHHSVTHDLPEVLKALGSNKVAFFIEAWNLHIYPEAIQSIKQAGHEIACHGMRHEIWCNLTPDQERDHIKRCVDDFSRYGIEIKGLRPPGGITAAASETLLPELGLTYISLLGVPTGLCDSGLANLLTVPGASDVAFYSPAFAEYRTFKPGKQILPPADFVDGMMMEIEKVVQEGGHLATVCHPFVQASRPGVTDPDRIEALAEVLRRINADDRIWLATPVDVVDWMTANPEQFPRLESLAPPPWWNPSFYKNIKRS